jgi:hypothetical protein
MDMQAKKEKPAAGTGVKGAEPPCKRKKRKKEKPAAGTGVKGAEPPCKITELLEPMKTPAKM